MKYLILLLLPLQSISQNITGLWSGTLYNDSTQKTLHYEILISERNGKYSGYSFTTFVLDSNEEVSGLKSIEVTRKFDHLYLEDIDLLYNNYPVAPPKGVRQRSTLLVPPVDSVLSLNGKFITTRTRQFGKPVTGLIQLSRTKEIGKSKIIPVLQKLGITGKLTLTPVKPPVVKEKPKSVKPRKAEEPLKKTDPLEELAKRKVETIETFFFTSDSLRLALYDNGYVDGDSVSIIVNGKVMLEHQLLSTQAITKTLHVPVGIVDSVNIIMYAENLGITAPNSGLLIIYDGEKRYEITFSGDLQKNAAIVLKRRK